jgi:hypothetical protein
VFTRTRTLPKEPLERRGSIVQFVPVQLTWMVLGLAILVIVAIIASPNLLEIYNSQKDFVVGSLFALVGFLFGKAFSRTHEQKALELIRDRTTPQVAAALSREIKSMLHDRGAFEELSVLERNVNAAAGRLLEYFDSQAAKLDFYRDSPPLTVALDDLDHAAANVVRLRSRMEGMRSTSDSATNEIGPAFASIHRDLHESNRRRIELYEHLKSRPGRNIDGDSWAILGVMTSDILKAERTLALLRTGCFAGSAGEHVSQIIGYLTAALARAEEFRESMETEGVAMPELFDVMTSDVHKALERISTLTSQVPGTRPEPANVVRDDPGLL